MADDGTTAVETTNDEDLNQSSSDDHDLHPNSALVESKRVLMHQVSNVSMPHQQSGLFGAASNMVNSIVGAGIIGIPFAISNTGFVVGVLMLILVGYLTDKSLRMIVELASFHPLLRHLGVLTFEDLARIPFGRWGAGFVLTVMFVMAYGGMVAYLLIIKDTVPTILRFAKVGEGGFVQRELVMVITATIIILPLAMKRDMASLSKTSLLSILADVFLTGFVVAFSPIQSTVQQVGGFGEVIRGNWANSGIFIGLGVLSFAMACQHSTFIVFNSLADKTPERWSKVTFRSVTIATILCLLLGVSGYLGFLDATKGNILNNFDSDSVMANAGRVLLAITMLLTYPMESFVARHVVVMCLYNGDMDGFSIGPSGEEVEAPKLLGILNRRHAITLVIFIGTLIPALVVDDLGPVLSITGALGASCISYIATGMVYLGVHGEDFLDYCQSILENRNFKVNQYPKPPEVTEVELPVVGDVSAKMSRTDGNVEDAPSEEMPMVVLGAKPWWWYLLGFPLWVAVASSGARGTRTFIQQLASVHDVQLDMLDLNPDHDNVIGPCRRDYYVSMFMICFGVMAAVVGVASNIYVQVHHIFQTPT